MTPKLDLGPDGDTLVISSTQLDELKKCPVSWKNRYLYRRVRAGADAALNAGGAFDAALNHRYTVARSKAAAPEVQEAMLAIIDKEFEGVDLPLEEHRTAARIKEVVVAYNEYWQEERFEVLGVQVPFKVELGTVTPSEQFWRAQGQYPWCSHEPTRGEVWTVRPVRVVMQGILDLFIRTAEHVMIVDTKTTAYDTPGKYANSAQMKCYAWALQELARLYPGQGFPPVVHGTLINEVIIRKELSEATKAKAEKSAAYAAKLRPRHEFRRGFPDFYKPAQLEEWRADTLLWVEQALGWVARDHFPQNERSCSAFGKSCPYLSVCLGPKEQREMALASDEFKDYERGPLATASETSQAA